MSREMKVLGIHIGHDSSASLVVDGRIVADAAEERFRRIKHCAGLPSRAIAYCLEVARATPGDIDAIAVPSKQALPQLRAWLGDSTSVAGGTTAERAARMLSA